MGLTEGDGSGEALPPIETDGAQPLRYAHGVRPNRAARRAGYRRQRKLFHLTWDDDHELHGLEVRARSVPIGHFLELIDAAAGIDFSKLTDLTAVPPEAVAAVRSLIDLFAEALHSWNLEDEEGTPVPCTAEGLRGEDADFVMPLIDAWMDAVAGVSGPLVPSSNGGGPSLEASLPMAPPSPSPPS